LIRSNAPKDFCDHAVLVILRPKLCAMSEEPFRIAIPRIASLDNIKGLNQGAGFNNPQLSPQRAQVRFNAHH
jgi:hypothetical protein